MAGSVLTSPESLEGQVGRLEQRFLESAKELRALRERLSLVGRAQEQVAEIRDEWEDVHRRWLIFVVAGLVTFFLASYLFYMNLGWYADQRVLPPSSDWLLDRLPTVYLIPVLSWGWLALHVWAVGAALLYTPRKMPFLLFLFGVFLFFRTLYVFLSPVGAPVHILDMRELDSLFALVAGEYTFQNEFIWSGHTAIPFLFFLFFDRPVHKGVMLLGSIVMGVCVLLTHNHYTVDVISAYLVGWAIFALSDRIFRGKVKPLYVRARPAARMEPSAS